MTLDTLSFPTPTFWLMYSIRLRHAKTFNGFCTELYSFFGLYCMGCEVERYRTHEIGGSLCQFTFLITWMNMEYLHEF